MRETVLGVGADLLCWEALAALPDLVSLAELQLSKDATVLSRQPLHLCLPVRQWAYGALPVHCPESWPPGWRALVRLELAVDCGRIGVAGVDASGSSRLRNGKYPSGPNRSRIDPRTTPWIVLRTTSAGEEAPEVTLSDVSAHVAGTSRIRIRPGPEPDPVVVLSPGKTATTEAFPSLPVRRTHFPTQEALAAVEQRAHDASRPAGTRLLFLQQAEQARMIRREIDAVATARGKIAYVCGCREPLDRSVSARFQTIEHDVPLLVESHTSDPEFIDALVAGLESVSCEHAGCNPIPGREPEWAWLW